jgi:hypothetical protein
MVSRRSVDGQLMDDDSDEEDFGKWGRGIRGGAVLIACFGDCIQIEYSPVDRPYGIRNQK